MNNNYLIGGLIVILLLVGGYFVLQSSGTMDNGTATTTPNTDIGDGTSGDTSGDTTGGDSTPSEAAPRIQTDAGAAVSNSTAVITGHVTPNGAPTTYWYEYGLTTALGSRTAAQSIGSGWTAIASPGYITGLKANTTYYFRLSAQNRLGTVSGTMGSFSTNNNPPSQGNAPAVTTNSATDVQRTSVVLNAHVNPRGTETTYWFEYGNDANFGGVTTFQSAGNGTASNAVSVGVTGLNPSTKYFFRVNAQNSYGTVNGATQSFTTPGPASPGVPAVDTTSATNIATSSAQLNGRISPNGAQTTYWFEYSKDSLLGSIIGTVTTSQDLSADATTLTVTAQATHLDRNARYFYRLVARNSFGTTRGDIENFRTRN